LPILALSARTAACSLEVCPRTPKKLSRLLACRGSSQTLTQQPSSGARIPQISNITTPVPQIAIESNIENP
jgi:hypothetical protein